MAKPIIEKEVTYTIDGRFMTIKYYPEDKVAEMHFFKNDRGYIYLSEDELEELSEVMVEISHINTKEENLERIDINANMPKL